MGKDAVDETAQKDASLFFDENKDIEFLRWQWVDMTGIVRARLTTIRQARKLLAEQGGISVASPLVNAFLVDGSFNDIHTGAKDDLRADWATLKRCYYEPGHAVVLCSIDEAGQDYSTCPRSVLKKLEKEILEKQDMSFLVGIEIEFYLTESPEATSPVSDIGPYCSTASLRKGNFAVLEDAVRCLEKAGIPVWTFHTELVEGLFDLQTDPMPPLQAADAVIYMHEAVKTCAAKRNLHATMHPKPFDKTHGVGQHMHISLTKQTEKDDSFLAGVLDSARAISAIAMPNYDSWERRTFAGGEWISWDMENRLCSVRKIKRAYWEFRFIDCTANNYLVLAAILGTGMKAWDQGKELKMKPLGARDWTSLDDATRAELGIKDRSPRDLREAVESLKDDQAVMDELGEEMGQRFVKYKLKEEALLAEMTLSERRRLCMSVF